MYALLGVIKFEPIGGFESFTATRNYEFSEHTTLGNKPYLQYSGEKLVSVSIKIKFHIGFCEPAVELLKLIASAKSRLKMPLLFGSGIFSFRGFYVIESITETVQITDKNGKLLGIEADLSLKEVSLYQIKEDAKSLYNKIMSLIG